MLCGKVWFQSIYQSFGKTFETGSGVEGKSTNCRTDYGEQAHNREELDSSPDLALYLQTQSFQSMEHTRNNTPEPAAHTAYSSFCDDIGRTDEVLYIIHN